MLFSAVVLSSGVGIVHAQGIISASPDVTIDLGADVVSADEEVIVDNQLGIVSIENIGLIPLPRASEMIALSVDVNGDHLIAFETTTLLAGGVVARPGDVVRYNGGVLYSIEFDASAEGLPSTVATDAVSAFENRLILSFDTTVDLGGGLVVADEDLVSWNGSTIRRILDGSASGIDSALDIDALQYLGGSRFLVSFDTSGEVGGVVFDDEDVLRRDGSTWSMEFDASAANSAWAAADLDAVVVPEPGLLGMVGVGFWLLVGLDRRRRRTWLKDGLGARKPEEQLAF